MLIISATPAAAISTAIITGIVQPDMHPPRYLLPGGGGGGGGPKARLIPKPKCDLIGGGPCPGPRPKPPRGPWCGAI